MRTRPGTDEYSAAFAGYVALIQEEDIFTVLQRQPWEAFSYARALAPEQECFRYAEGKWSVREVFGHVIECERVFAYRALCISRGDTASLPAFDENAYVRQSRHHEIGLDQHLAEFRVLREANMFLFRSLSPEAWTRVGIAGHHPVSVRALAYIMGGHVRHHFAVLRERYGFVPRA